MNLAFYKVITTWSTRHLITRWLHNNHARSSRTTLTKKIPVIYLSPGTVWGISITQNDDVFGCVGSGLVFNIKKFSSDGLFVLELDPAMFTPRNWLWNVHAVSDDVICVQDGHLVVNDKYRLVFETAAGQLISRVTRTGKLREVSHAIVWDDHGYILTGEWLNDFMHVFSEEGACTQTYKVEGLSAGIHSLCLGKDGCVWIGTVRGEVITAKYLL